MMETCELLMLHRRPYSSISASLEALVVDLDGQTRVTEDNMRTIPEF